jgi:PilZ domain-containing protein
LEVRELRQFFAHEKTTVGTERRKHPRVRVLLDGHWQARSTSGFYQLADLSLGGCFLQARSKAPPVGQTGNLTIYFKHDGPMSIEGEVVHVSPMSGVGLRFPRLTSSHQFQLGIQLETLREQEYGDRFPVRAYVWKTRRPVAVEDPPESKKEESHGPRKTKTPSRGGAH